MKRNAALLFWCAYCFMLLSCNTETSVIWIEGAKNPETKHAVHEILICNPPKGLDWDIWGVYDRTWTMPIAVQEGSDADMEKYDGVCVRITPRVNKDTLRIRYDNRYLNKNCRAPRGFNLKFRNRDEVLSLPIEYKFLPTDTLEEDTYEASEVGITDIVPQIKKITTLEGQTTVEQKIIKYVPEQKSGWYRITINDSTVIEATDSISKDYAEITLNQILANKGDKQLPNMIIEDWPDFQTRAFMLDVARNFIPKENVFTLIDLLYRAKINTLLLHLSDDEGWRIEIDGLPELTSFGAFHAIPEYDKTDGKFHTTQGLFPSQNGQVGKVKPWISGNGYYSREEYKEILKYAAARHITVIPEIDIPGHCSSAIESMRYRARTTGDESYLLTDPNDQSQHMAYQGYLDNVIDPGLPAVYKFIGHVFDDLIRIYQEAGLPLETINIAGDEVAEGCWLNSPACQKILKENHWTTTEQLWSYFLGKVIDMLAERHLKFAGYAETVVGTDEQTLNKMRDNAAFIIVWRPLNSPAELNYIPYHFANLGFKILLSHADHTYMDNAYYKHKEEWGLDWGGTTNERYAYAYNPLHLFEGDEAKTNPLTHPENIIGIEPMLWGDNIYTFEKDCYLLFPKIYGQFERCWNAVPDNSEEGFGKFYSIVVKHELPHLDSLGITHRHPMKSR